MEKRINFDNELHYQFVALLLLQAGKLEVYEVQVFGGPVALPKVNVALNKEAFMSSEKENVENGSHAENKYTFGASNGCDGISGTCALTNVEVDPWCVVDLNAKYNIKSVSIIAEVYGDENPVIWIMMGIQFDANTNVQRFDPKWNSWISRMYGIKVVSMINFNSRVLYKFVSLSIDQAVN